MLHIILLLERFKLFCLELPYILEKFVLKGNVFIPVKGEGTILNLVSSCEIMNYERVCTIDSFAVSAIGFPLKFQFGSVAR